MKYIISLVTGATSGIGKAAAMGLAEEGYSLILTGRNSRKGILLANHIQKIFPGISAEFIPADLSSFKSVRKLADEVSSGYKKIDVLINNAGARFNDYKKSDDGIELTFATNHLGHFLLTHLLLDLLKKSPSARIINVSSSAHSGCSNDFSNAVMPVHYDRKEVYCKSKLANLLFTYELADRLKSTEVTVNAVDPGGVLTNLGKNNGLMAWFRHIAYYIINGQLQLPVKGAETIIYLSVSPEIEKISGRYFYDKRETESSGESRSKEAALKLWDLSCELCGIDKFYLS